MHGILPLFLALSLAQAPAPAAPAPGTPASMARLAGRVTLEGANTPISGARVMLTAGGGPMGPAGPPPMALTDQDGRFMFDKLAPGQYRVNVQKTGFVTPIDVPSHPISLAAGQSLDTFDVHMQKGGVIAGKLLDSSGEPQADARVMAMRRIAAGRAGSPQRLVPAPVQGPQQTNDLGEFRITGLPAGEYVVAAVPGFGFGLGGPSASPSANGMAPATTYYPGSTDPAGAQPLSVSAGQAVENIDFAMLSAPAFSVTGVVVDENDAPVAGATVMLMNDPRSGAFMGPIGSARTEDDGRFAIVAVPNGSYRANASVPVMMGSGGGSSGSAGIGAVSSGYVMSSSSGFVQGGLAGSVGPIVPAEVVVNGANLTGVRVVVRRPVPSR